MQYRHDCSFTTLSFLSKLLTVIKLTVESLTNPIEDHTELKLIGVQEENDRILAQEHYHSASKWKPVGLIIFCEFAFN